MDLISTMKCSIVGSWNLTVILPKIEHFIVEIRYMKNVPHFSLLDFFHIIQPIFINTDSLQYPPLILPRARWWRGQCLQFLRTLTYFPPFTSRNSLVYLKKIEGGCYPRHVYYLCARQIFRRQKNIYNFFLVYLINFIIWTMSPSASVTRTNWII